MAPPEFSGPHLIQLRATARRNSTRESSLTPPGWGRGCQPHCPAATAQSLAGDIPTPCCCSRGAIPGLSTLPWELGQTAAVLSLAHPNPITDAGFSQSRELSGGQHTTTSVCADLAHLSELQHSWTLALHKVLKGTSHVLVTDGS